MKKIFYLLFAALCIVACSEKNTPTNNGGNNDPDPNGGDNETSTSLMLLEKESITYVKEHGQTGEQRRDVKYEYNANYDLVASSVHGLGGLLAEDMRYSWNGNRRIGEGDRYNAGVSYMKVYDTTEYADNAHKLYTKISTRQVQNNGEGWTVNLYEYSGDKQTRQTCYISGSLYSDYVRTYVGNYCYSERKYFGNYSNQNSKDTCVYNAKGLVESSKSWSYIDGVARSHSINSYIYRDDAVVYAQQSGCRYESYFFNEQGDMYFSTVSSWTYTWKGDSIRYGITDDGFSTDTTYYLVIRSK